MTKLVSMAGSPGPLERTQGARTMTKTVWKPEHIKDHDLPDVPRKRGRPRKNPDAPVSEKRGSQTSHGPEHYAEIRYKRKLAGITHKQFRILEEDEAEAERLLMPLINKATMAYHRVALTNKVDVPKIAPFQYKVDEEPAEPDPLDDLEPVAVSQEPPTASLPEIEAAPVPEPAEKPKPIRERGKLSLKAFRKDAP